MPSAPRGRPTVRVKGSTHLPAFVPNLRSSPRAADLGCERAAPFKEGRCLVLPDKPNLDWLRKQAKRRLDDLRRENPNAQLADAQLSVAREHGFSSWRALKAHIDALTVGGQLFGAARAGDLSTLIALLDAHPDSL